MGTKRILVANGPNLNLLGTRQPEVYGSATLNELESLIRGWGSNRDVEVSCFQSNHEGEIIDRLHDSRHAHDGVIINAGALTHYSYSLHDAIVAINLPTVEVHISNIMERESWRRVSVIGPACNYMIRGRGIDGYRYAIDYLVNRAKAEPETIAYGSEADQVGDLLLPDGPGPHPVAVLIHGGFWRDRWTRDTMDGIAIDLRGCGWATWNIEYRRVGTGGGWPQTFDDVGAAIDQLRHLAADYDIDPERVVAIGHSAGGHLALWSASRPSGVAVFAAVGLAPVSDLSAAYDQAIGDYAVAGLMGDSPSAAPDRYATSSPAQLLPLGAKQIIVHGAEDSAVPVEMTRSYVSAAREAGDDVVYTEMVGGDHMSLIDPASPTWPTVVSHLESLRQELQPTRF